MPENTEPYFTSLNKENINNRLHNLLLDLFHCISTGANYRFKITMKHINDSLGPNFKTHIRQDK